jgi:O-methyltransferase
MKISHPVGNKKIFILKSFTKFLSYIILLFLSFFLKINRRKSEIIISTAFYAPWKEDNYFSFFYNKVKNLTLLDARRAYTLWYLSSDLKNINGNILDVGCLQGGAGFLMAKVNKKGSTYLLDTFEGFLEEEKFHKKKHFIYKEIDVVKDNLKKLKLKNTIVSKCKFPNNLSPSFKKKKFKLCHLDVNTYKSTKNAFQFIKDKMIKGGVIVFDDYGIHTVDSIKKFVDEISKKYKKDYSFIYNYMGQCILIKK